MQHHHAEQSVFMSSFEAVLVRGMHAAKRWRGQRGRVGDRCDSKWQGLNETDLIKGAGQVRAFER